MTKYPIGLQNFQGLREDGYIYVDKTAFVYELASTGKYYFLSRPRRFGKSLLLSTIEAYFQGEKELFKGLALEQLEKDWKVYPVLHLDLNVGKFDTPEALYERLDHYLSGWERTYNLVPETSQSPTTRFENVIGRAYEKTGQKVVILVDEYDKPLLQAIGNQELQDEYRAILKSVYGVSKTMDGYIQMAFFTGVTKILVDSLLGDLNNITNISLYKHFAGICGLTEEDVRNNFDAEIGLMAERNHLTKDECYTRLKENYGGYHFSEKSADIYNPFYLMNALNTMKFKDFWPDTDTISFLFETLKQNNYKLENLTQEDQTDLFLHYTEMFGDSTLAFLYQNGFLTIKNYDQIFDAYQLGIPNEMVKHGISSIIK